MPKIETQGLSEDYQTATGKFEPIARGDLTKMEILGILNKVYRLTTPEESNSCPPSVNVQLSGDFYSCFFGDSGVIRCADSREEIMTPDIAARIICGELSIEEYDLSKGHKPSSNFVPTAIVLVIFAVAAIYFFST